MGGNYLHLNFLSLLFFKGFVSYVFFLSFLFFSVHIFLPSVFFICTIGLSFFSLAVLYIRFYLTVEVMGGWGMGGELMAWGIPIILMERCDVSSPGHEENLHSRAQ